MAEDEIELKLSLEQGDVERFRREPLIHRAKQGRAQSKALLAVYFDTPDLALRGRKAALRLRQEGTERIQTLKTAAGGAGLLRRTEFNAPTDAQTPDLTLIGDEAVRAEIEALVGNSGLVPVFSTDVKRTAWMLELPGAAVELALDVGRIESNGNAVEICEAELELKGGAPLALLDFAEALAMRYRCRVSDESKAARGYALYAPQPAKPRKAEKLSLDPEAPAWAALGRIVEEGAAQIFGNEAAVLDATDIEGIHQARVAVRRTRAALSAFRAILPDEIRKPLNKSLRRHQVALGPARDWDVFIDETLGPLCENADAPKSLRRFLSRAEEARRMAYVRAHKAIRSQRYGRMQLALIRFPYLPAPQGATMSTGSLASALLDERLQAVAEAAGPNPIDLPEAELHMLRIDIKKFRYALDFFVSLYPPDALKPWRSASKRLQECLGGLNDAAVHAALVESMDAPDRPVPKRVRAVIADHNAKKVETGLSVLSERWHEFQTLEPFWR